MDKITVTCIAATTEPKDTHDLQNVALTMNNLYSMYNDIQEKEIPIMANFCPDNIIGIVLGARVIDNKLEIIAELEYVEPLIATYIVPGYRVNDVINIYKEEELTEYKDITLFGMGTTMQPIDENVTVFKVIDKDG